MIKRRTNSGFPEVDLRAISTSFRLLGILRDQIVTMQLVPGAAVSEKEVGDAFGVSRTPVREAMRRLAEERLVEIYPQHGTFVSRIRLEAVRDAMVIREALETITAREAANKATTQDIAELRRLVNVQRSNDRAGNLPEFHAGDEEFHEAIARIAGHPNLWRVVKQEKVQVDRCRMLTLPQPARRRSVVAQHTAIIDAIAGSDPASAARAMSTHLGSVLPSFEHLEAEYPSYFETNGKSFGGRKRASARVVSR